jgi:uncharacterized protein YggE
MIRWAGLALVTAIWLVNATGGGAGGVAAAETPVPDGTVPTISVSAEGSVLAEPDVAYVQFAVETRGQNAREAQRANAEIFAAVEDTLKNTFRVAARDIRTVGFNVYPEYDYTEKNGRELKGYVATHVVQVTWRDLQDVGRLLDGLAAAGANRMEGVTFGTEKREQYELEALKKAMAAARAKADALAASAGRQVKGVLHIVQGSPAAVPVLFRASAEVSADAASGSPATSIQTGQIEIRTSVSVQFEMQ